MSSRASKAPGLLVSALALLLAPAFLYSAEKPTAQVLQVSDSPPVVPVVSPPLRDVPPDAGGKIDQKTINNIELPHAGLRSNRPDVPDPVLQRNFGITAPTPTGTNFDGNSANGSAPPDSDGRVGPNHYIQMINQHFAIFDKAGTLLYGPANNNTLFLALGPSSLCVSHNNGDPIVVYDALADRWILTQFVVPGPSHQCVAISVTGDPLGSYYLYDFLTDGVNFVDYPHWGVWPDSYYMTAHLFTNPGAYLGQTLYSFERPKMLAGLPARVQGALLGAAFGGALPSDLDGLTPPPPGSSNYVIAPGSPELDGTASDVLHVWKAFSTWGATPTFTITGPTDLATAAFNPDMCGEIFTPFPRNCIPEPAPATPADYLNAISDRLIYRLAYRNSGGTESLVMNHTVNVAVPSGHASNQAGIRWYEVRTPATSPSIFQQGTYAPDTSNRWMGSIAMDNSGNMALGYSKSDTSILPEIDVTGRLAADAPGTMGAEVLMKAGLGVQTDTGNRWGDYSYMSVDPRDGCTFWYTNQYQPANGTFNWASRIASFRFANCVSPARGTIQGIVTDSVTGQPISGALVLTDNGFSSATDTNGRYQIVLPPGAVNVTATAPRRNCTPSASQPATVTNGGLVTLNFTLTGTPLLALGPVGIDDSIGNNNGKINRNECVKLNLPLNNIGCATATGISAVLSTSTAGVTITQPNSGYANIPAGATAFDTTPFQIATSPSFVCGTDISFTLTVTSSAGTTPLPFTVPTCQAATVVNTGSITNTDLTETARMGRNGIQSSCGGKTCPGPLGSGARHYDAYTFTNTAPGARCVTVTLTAACAPASNGDVFSVGYVGSFDPTNLCLNYAGDSGGSPFNGNSVPYSFTVPAGGNFVVIVNESTANAGCTSYTIGVDGLTDNSDAGRPSPPTAASNSPVCAGQTLNLTASTIAGATYLWTGPNGFTSTQQNPSIPNVTLAATGTYTVIASIGGCSADPATTSVLVKPVPVEPITAPQSAKPGSTTNAASVPDAGPGATYVWSINSGVITGGNGTSSINFSAGVAGSVLLTVTVTGSNGCSVTNTKAVPVAVGDLDGDGKTDIFLRNQATGANALWRFNATAFLGVVDLAPLGNLNFQMKGVGDFNGDGKMDIVFRNYSTGQNVVWLMNGTTFTSPVSLPTLADTNWHIEAVGDVNGDGAPDIYLRNHSTGQNAVWTFTGTTFTGVIDLPGLADTNWHLEGVGDVNGDGKADILWRNYSTGQNAVWLMNGGTFLSIVDLPGLANTDYHFDGFADFNGDGSPDIVLRNGVTGMNAFWLLNGTNLVAVVDMPALTDTNWKFGGPK